MAKYVRCFEKFEYDNGGESFVVVYKRFKNHIRVVEIDSHDTILDLDEIFGEFDYKHTTLSKVVEYLLS